QARTQAQALQQAAEVRGSNEPPKTEPPKTEASTTVRAPLTPEEVRTGVRMAKDLPGGGRLKLLKDGTFVTCHSPCQAVVVRFQRELNLADPEAQAFQGRLNTIAEQERAAVAAGDTVAEEHALIAADTLDQDLEAFRLRRIHGMTGVDEATLRNLIRLGADDAALVETLLQRTGHDPARVQPLLEAASGDVNALARLSQAADMFPTRQMPAGGVVRDSRFAPYATEANMPHFLERHSIEHFDFQQVGDQNTFWPEGTTTADVQESLVEALDMMRRNQDQFPPNKLRIYQLRSGVVVNVIRNNGEIVQFYPRHGPGVQHFSKQELTAIGRLLGRLP
ncbi:MAG: hypothetical protein DLM61_08345, partial [Pseudonocardiales bacterium]